MNKLRKWTLVAALLGALCLDGTAFAGASDDASRADRTSRQVMRVVDRIVQVLEDLRMIIPPG
jgi:hypothetical protein